MITFILMAFCVFNWCFSSKREIDDNSKNLDQNQENNEKGELLEDDFLKILLYITHFSIDLQNTLIGVIFKVTRVLKWLNGQGIGKP
jgi:hypothetical protein